MDEMNGMEIILYVIFFVIGYAIGHFGIGEIRMFRFLNRIHRYIYVPLFRKEWTKFDELWYNKWERKKEENGRR